MNKRVHPSELEVAAPTLEPEAAPHPPAGLRKKLFAGLAVAVLAAGAAWGGYEVLVASGYAEPT